MILDQGGAIGDCLGYATGNNVPERNDRVCKIGR